MIGELHRYENLVSDSAAWYKRSSDGRSVCANCVWKYHNAVKIAPTKPAASNVEPPPFMFRPVKEEQDWKHVRVVLILSSCAEGYELYRLCVQIATWALPILIGSSH